MEIGLRNSDLSTYVDEEDYEWARGYKWRLDWKGYVIRTLPRAEGHGRGYMHREILQRMGYEMATMAEQTDHRNGVRHDNRRENLRVATSTENRCNSKVRVTSASGVKGVRRDTKGRWEATIELHGRMAWRKYFKTVEEAAAARAAVLPLYHGTFARAG